MAGNMLCSKGAHSLLGNWEAERERGHAHSDVTFFLLISSPNGCSASNSATVCLQHMAFGVHFRFRPQKEPTCVLSLRELVKIEVLLLKNEMLCEADYSLVT